ncbi:MAG: gamma-glutamyltransferase [Verrucomicrobiales bacterium]
MSLPRKFSWRYAGAPLLYFLSILVLQGQPRPSAVEHGAIATVHPLATDAAREAFRNGGNAVDAAIAAALTLGVVDGHNSGIGGGCFMLIRTPAGKVFAIDGRETAPAKASRDMFLRNGKAEGELSQVGALAIGIPGSLAVYGYVSKTFGKVPLSGALNHAANIAEKGFPLDDSYVSRLKDSTKLLARFPESKALLLGRDNEPHRPGFILKQPDLARSYRNIAKDGIEWFYKGVFPEKVETWMKLNGGLITAEDFKSYQIRVREPIATHYRGYKIYGFPPPSSGGVHVAQILNILEGFDLPAAEPYSLTSVHWIAEAMKLAFADRAYWLGDPDFVKIPRGLISKDYADVLRSKIKHDKTLKLEGHHVPPDAGNDSFRKHTTHFSTADSSGWWVACTATVNTSFGAKVIIPGTGIIMNNQMDDFSLQPGVPNYFGLVGAEANAVGPGKRPLSSMSPTIVEKDGIPLLSLGAAGGPTIISQTVVNLVNILDHGMSINEALTAPRIHHQWNPDELKIEKEAPDSLLQELRELGHKVVPISRSGAAQIVGQNDGKFEAAHDPRLKGKAASF